MSAPGAGGAGREPRAFVVVADRSAVLQLEARPGHLRSMAAPPEGFTPPEHPFVDASSLDPLREDALRTMLLASASFDDFVGRLIAGGFDLMSRGNDTWDLPPVRRVGRDGRVVGALWAQGGQFTSVGWQPVEGANTYAHATITAYVDEEADALLGALAATDTVEALEDVLRDLGLTLD